MVRKAAKAKQQFDGLRWQTIRNYIKTKMSEDDMRSDARLMFALDSVCTDLLNIVMATGKTETRAVKEIVQSLPLGTHDVLVASLIEEGFGRHGVDY